VQVHANDNGEVVALVLSPDADSGTIEKVIVGGRSVQPGTFRTTIAGLLMRLVVSPSRQRGGAPWHETELEAASLESCELVDEGPPLTSERRNER
jgi:hypothetical protein